MLPRLALFSRSTVETDWLISPGKTVLIVYRLPPSGIPCPRVGRRCWESHYRGGEVLYGLPGFRNQGAVQAPPADMWPLALRVR